MLSPYRIPRATVGRCHDRVTPSKNLLWSSERGLTPKQKAPSEKTEEKRCALGRHPNPAVRHIYKVMLFLNTLCTSSAPRTLPFIYQRLRQKKHLLHELEREVRLRVLGAQQNAPDVRVCRRVRLHRAKPYPSGHLSKTPPTPSGERQRQVNAGYQKKSIECRQAIHQAFRAMDGHA